MYVPVVMTPLTACKPGEHILKECGFDINTSLSLDLKTDIIASPRKYLSPTFQFGGHKEPPGSESCSSMAFGLR